MLEACQAATGPSLPVVSRTMHCAVSELRCIVWCAAADAPGAVSPKPYVCAPNTLQAQVAGIGLMGCLAMKASRPEMSNFLPEPCRRRWRTSG